MVSSPRSSQDPLPEYVSPELVRLIAKNAPAELDFFVQYLRHSKPSPRTPPRKSSLRSPRQQEVEKESRAVAVEVLLNTIKERNEWVARRRPQSGGQQSFSVQPTARSDVESLSSTRSSPERRTGLFAREKELRNASLEGLESDVTRILGRDFTLTKHSEKVQWPLPPEARLKADIPDNVRCRTIRKPAVRTRGLEWMSPLSKFEEFFVGKTVVNDLKEFGDEISSPSPTAERQMPLHLKKTVPGKWETFAHDAKGSEINSAGKDRFSPSKPRVNQAGKEKPSSAWIPAGQPSRMTFGVLPPMGPHSSRPASARLPVGNRPISTAWVPPGQASRRPVSAPSGSSSSKPAGNGQGTSRNDSASSAQGRREFFKRAWDDFTASDAVDRRLAQPYARPWRWGMPTTSSIPVEQPIQRNATRKGSSEKLTEILKFMEKKQFMRRKEQRDKKRKADAQAIAKKEKERLLQLHHQAMTELEAERAKDKPPVVRPAWNSDFDPARPDGIGPWASSEGGFLSTRSGLSKLVTAESQDVNPVHASGLSSRTSEQPPNEDTDSPISQNIHVVLRSSKGRKGKSRQHKTPKSTKPKDPFSGSNKKARWKNSTTMNHYGGSDALKRRELMQIYGVLQRRRREVIDSRKKKVIRSLQGGRKKSSKGAISGSSKTMTKGKGKSKEKRRREKDAVREASVIPCPDERQKALTSRITEGAQSWYESNSAPAKEENRNLSSIAEKHESKEKNQPVSTSYRRKGSDAKPDLSLPTKKRKGQPDVKVAKLRPRDVMNSSPISAPSAAKQRKLESPPLVYFSDSSQNHDFTAGQRPGSPFRQFASTTKQAGTGNVSPSSEKDRKRVCGGGFVLRPPSPKGRGETKDIRSESRPEARKEQRTCVQSVRISGPSTTGSTQGVRASTQSVRASYSAMAIPPRPGASKGFRRGALDLSELEQAGVSLSGPYNYRASEQTQTPELAEAGETMDGANNCNKSIIGDSAALPSICCSSAPSSLDVSRTNCREFQVSPCKDKMDSNKCTTGTPQNLKEWSKEVDTSSEVDGMMFDYEWKLPRTRDSFSIINVYSKRKAEQLKARERKNAPVSSTSSLPREVGNYGRQQQRLSFAETTSHGHRSLSSSSGMKTYSAVAYTDDISDLGDSEAIVAEIMTEISGKPKRRPSQRPATADFVRTMQNEFEASAVPVRATERSNGKHEFWGEDLLSRHALKTRPKKHLSANSKGVLAHEPYPQAPTRTERMETQPLIRASQISIDGTTLDSAMRACTRESCAEHRISQDDAEALALYKVRMQLRKEQRLLRKLRRMQHLDDAESQGFSAETESHIAVSSDGMWKLQASPKKSAKCGEDLKVSAVQPVPKGSTLTTKHEVTPEQPSPQVQRRTAALQSMKKSMLHQVKLDKKTSKRTVPGVAKQRRVVAPKRERKKPSLVQKSKLEKKIQRLTSQIGDITPTAGSNDQEKPVIASQSFFTTTSPFMAFTIDDRHTRSIASAVKIISIDDIASDSSELKASTRPVEANSREASLSNMQGYSDSFLSENTTSKVKDEGSMSLSAANARSAGIVRQGDQGRASEGTRSVVNSLGCHGAQLGAASLQQITDVEFEIQKLSTPVMQIGGGGRRDELKCGRAHKDPGAPGKVTQTSADTSSCLKARQSSRFGEQRKHVETVAMNSNQSIQKRSPTSTKSPVQPAAQATHCAEASLSLTDRTGPNDMAGRAQFRNHKGRKDVHGRTSWNDITSKESEESIISEFSVTSVPRTQKLKQFNVPQKEPRDGLRSTAVIEDTEIEEEIILLAELEDDKPRESVYEGLTTIELPPFQGNSQEAGDLFIANRSVPINRPYKLINANYQIPSKVAACHLADGTRDKDVENQMPAQITHLKAFRTETVDLQSPDNSTECTRNYACNNLQSPSSGEEIRPFGTDKKPAVNLSCKEMAAVSRTHAVVETAGQVKKAGQPGDALQTGICLSIISEHISCNQTASTAEEDSCSFNHSVQEEDMKVESCFSAISSRPEDMTQTKSNRQEDDNESSSSVSSPCRIPNDHSHGPDEGVVVPEKKALEDHQQRNAALKETFHALLQGVGKSMQPNDTKPPMSLDKRQQLLDALPSLNDSLGDKSQMSSSVDSDTDERPALESNPTHLEDSFSSSGLCGKSTASDDNQDAALTHEGGQTTHEAATIQNQRAESTISTQVHATNKPDEEPSSIPVYHMAPDAIIQSTWNCMRDEDIPEDIVCEDEENSESRFTASGHSERNSVESHETWTDRCGQIQGFDTTMSHEKDRGTFRSARYLNPSIEEEADSVQTSKTTSGETEASQTSTIRKTNGAGNGQAYWPEMVLPASSSEEVLPTGSPKCDTTPVGTTTGACEGRHQQEAHENVLSERLVRPEEHARAQPSSTYLEVRFPEKVSQNMKEDDHEAASRFRGSRDEDCRISNTDVDPRNTDVLQPSDVARKRPLSETERSAKYSLLADVLTSTLLDNMLQAELSETVDRKVHSTMGVSAGQWHDPFYNSANSIKRKVRTSLRPPLHSDKDHPNIRTVLQLPKQTANSPKGLKVPPHSAAPAERENCPPWSLTPSYATEYVETLIRFSSHQGTGTVAGNSSGKQLELDRKVFNDIQSYQKSVTGKNSAESPQNMYNRVLFDAVNESCQIQASLVSPMCKNIHDSGWEPGDSLAGHPLQTALAAIIEDVELVNSTGACPDQSQGFLQKQVITTGKEWHTSWLEANVVLVTEIADAILADMLNSMILDMPKTRLCLAYP